MQTRTMRNAGAASHWRLVFLVLAVTVVAVMAGVSLADLRAPAERGWSAAAPASDDALAVAARSHHSPLAETAPSALPVESAMPVVAEPLIRSAE